MGTAALMLRRVRLIARATGIATGCALVAAGCFLPPRAEDRPLTAEVDSGPRVDSSVGGARTTEATARVTAPAIEEAAARVDGTDVLESAGGPGAAPVEDAANAAGEQDAARPESVGEETEAPVVAREPDVVAVTDAPAAEQDTETAASPDVVPTSPVARTDQNPVAPQDESATQSPASTDLVPAVVEETVVEAAPESPEGPAAPGEAGLRVATVGTSDGLEMTYSVREPLEEEEGSAARTLVLVHGWCGLGSQWQSAAEALPGARLIVVDLIGHGASAEQARVEWTVPRFGADIARLLGAEDLRDVVLVGHGMGGQVCLEAAARSPERVGAIVGVDCLQRLAGDPNPGRLQQFVETFRKDYETQMRQFVGAAVATGTAEALTERIAAEALAAHREMALALMEHFGTHDPRRAAPRIECPVVCINSGSLATDVQGNRALLSSFDVEVLEGPGHWIHLEVPKRFAQALRGVLQGLEPQDVGGRQLHSLSPVLVVEDPESVARFYTERLSFRLARRSPQDLAQPAELITLDRDGARVVLQALESLRGDLPGAEIQPRSGVLFLRVDSIAAELRAVDGAAVIVAPERVLATGDRQVTLSDPEGNLVVLQQSSDSSAGGR